jgi:hypothetical protein
MDEPLLENVEIEDQYISDIYRQVLKRTHKTMEEGIHESDLWFDMFCADKQYWWMSIEHPYVAMIEENNKLTGGAYPKSQLFEGACGVVVVYTTDIMRECISSIVKLCEAHGFKINIIND